MSLWAAVTAHVLGAVVIWLLCRVAQVWEKRHRAELDLLIEGWIERVTMRIRRVQKHDTEKVPGNPAPRHIDETDEIVRTLRGLAKRRGYRLNPFELRLQVKEILAREKPRE